MSNDRLANAPSTHGPDLVRLIIQHGGWPRITSDFQLKIRGWRQLPASVQQLIREHERAIIACLGLPAELLQATPEEVRRLEGWLADGLLAEIDQAVPIKPGWIVPGPLVAENVTRLLEGHRKHYGNRTVVLQQLRLFMIALEPVISACEDRF